MHTCQTIGVGHKTSDVEGLVSQSALDDFWDMATSEMLSVLQQHCVRRKGGREGGRIEGKKGERNEGET